MKPRGFNKKLFLNKTTVANLSNRQMSNVYGGTKKETLEESCCLACGGTTTCPSESLHCPPSSDLTDYTCNDPCHTYDGC